jgi:hypothetical protein
LLLACVHGSLSAPPFATPHPDVRKRAGGLPRPHRATGSHGPIAQACPNAHSDHPGRDAHLEHGVEVGRVTLAVIDERRATLYAHVALQVVFWRRKRVTGRQRRGVRAGPADVAGERVDLAVVAHHAHRLRERPARLGVGREATVVDRKLRLEALVAQVVVKATQVARGEHALVHDRARGDRRDVGAALARALCVGHRAPDHVERVLERVALDVVLRRFKHDLLHERTRGRGVDAAHALVDRHRARRDDAHPASLKRGDHLRARLVRRLLTAGVVSR